MIAVQTKENPQAGEEKASAKTWDGLSRMAFAANWDPETAINWNQPIELGKVREGWINILHYFYEGEWQGLEIIQRLMNKAAHMFHNCSGACHEYTNNTFATIKTNRTGEHRSTDGNF